MTCKKGGMFDISDAMLEWWNISRCIFSWWCFFFSFTDFAIWFHFCFKSLFCCFVDPDEQHIYVICHICPAIQMDCQPAGQLSCVAKTFTLDTSCKLFNQLVSISVMLKGTVELYYLCHFQWPWLGLRAHIHTPSLCPHTKSLYPSTKHTYTHTHHPFTPTQNTYTHTTPLPPHKTHTHTHLSISPQIC